MTHNEPSEPSEPNAPDTPAPTSASPVIIGRVLRGDAKAFDVLVDGETRRAAPRGKLFEELGETRNPVAVGDLVRLTEDGTSLGIEEVLPRRNKLSKVSSSHDPREQVLFANVDQVVIVNSIGKPGFSSNRTDRILAACQMEEIPAIVLLNKVDLDRGGEVESIHATYKRAGCAVLETSATANLGLEALRERLVGKTSVMYGASGVGKSTLLNALFGLDLAIGKISKYWSSGKHTTTFSRWIPIDATTAVVDTPGIRVFRLFGINRRQLEFLYPDFAPYRGRCHFPNCAHDHEPDCAVADAVEAGKLASTRYLSYVEILDELNPPPDVIETMAPPASD